MARVVVHRQAPRAISSIELFSAWAFTSESDPGRCISFTSETTSGATAGVVIEGQLLENCVTAAPVTVVPLRLSGLALLLAETSQLSTQDFLESAERISASKACTLTRSHVKVVFPAMDTKLTLVTDNAVMPDGGRLEIDNRGVLIKHQNDPSQSVTLSTARSEFPTVSLAGALAFESPTHYAVIDRTQETVLAYAIRRHADQLCKQPGTFGDLMRRSTSNAGHWTWP